MPDADWLEAIADLLINLAAGWFGTVLIVPNFSGVEYPDNLKILTTDIVLGIVSLIIAVKLKRTAKRRRK